jgi:hypothetical protein
MHRGWLLVVLAVTVALAGCGGAGDRTPEPIEATAAQATVDATTLSETGFTESAVEQVRVNRSGQLTISGDVNMDLAAIVGGAQDTYSEPTDLEHARNRTTTVLGARRTVQQFSGTATAGGEPSDVTVSVATVEHDGDVVRAVAVTSAGTDDWPRLRGLFGGVTH